ncbi:hypothetical protein A7A08_02158 [Methyloligella halotolerans]|uniref:DUF1214 domain-containing protein n=1 Tax=Methyloligella halotolerans TaxID=1177755 RepID=A0A1E2RXB2_9HYPH|nr:DUF1214 domain-containing protein [Methyloligella halotolerans]ODA66861.1 hypothetical protein A7A08_02158 [Methyloligella halotolerans]
MRFLLFGIVAFAAALVLGFGSALLVLRHGLPYVTERHGPWVSWPSEGHTTADPYTRAYLAESGRLPLASNTVRYFSARDDDSGRGLTANCDYRLQGGALNARWWSLALYDADGELIDNPSDRHSINSEGMIRRSDGTFEVALSPHARPGNWLPAGEKSERPLVLMLRIYYPAETDPDGVGKIDLDRLPKIERLSCG